MIAVDMMVEVVSGGEHIITIFAKVLNTARKVNVLYMLSHVASIIVLFATYGTSENPSILGDMFIKITYKVQSQLLSLSGILHRHPLHCNFQM